MLPKAAASELNESSISYAQNELFAISYAQNELFG
jgi:hypothetical protein